MDAFYASNSGEHTVSNSFSARLLRHEIVRGLLGRCPCCGKGRMFGAFLKVKDYCEVCGEELHHHRADDFPAYVVILIVGHLLVPAVLSVETNFAPRESSHPPVSAPSVSA
jgi:uncharacterized protein (DUF983 family)